MQLISRDGFVTDAWRRLDENALDGAELPDTGDVIIDHHRLTAFTSGEPRSGRTGLHIDNDASAPALHNVLSRLDLISIDFPATGDGRGFSLARQLRDMGYTGELRAFGPLIVDQFALAIACGFDTVEIPHDLAKRQPQEQWRAALGEITTGFQPNYPAATNVLSRRHAT